MRSNKYEKPTKTFPYPISWRLNQLSEPRAYIVDLGEDMPVLTPRGIRMSALRGAPVDQRIIEVSYPYVRKLDILKKQYKRKFSETRLENIDRLIDLSSVTRYSKLAHYVITPRLREEMKSNKRKRGWNESDWKKHMDYIGCIACPKKLFEPEPIDRGTSKPLEELMPNVIRMATVTPSKMFRRLSQQEWYRNPTKVSPAALKYKLSDRTKKLAVPKAIHTY